MRLSSLYMHPLKFAIVLLVSFVFCNSVSSFSFETSVLKGKVTDIVTLKPIPFCHVTNTIGGASVYSNLNGEFEIEGKGDERLVISCIGYKNDTINIPALGIGNLKILLEPSVMLLKEVLITNSLNDKRAKLGYRGKSLMGGYDLLLKIPESPKPDYHSDLSFTIEYDPEYVGRIVKNINIGGIMQSGAIEYCYVRVKFFKYDDKEILGKEPLMDKNVFDYVQPSKKKMITIDIEEYSIRLPEKGIKVIVEFLGLFDEGMKSVEGGVILYSSKEKTNEPKSFMIKEDGEDGIYMRDSKGRYFNLNCWIEL